MFFSDGSFCSTPTGTSETGSEPGNLSVIQHHPTRWWFQPFFIFTPIWGRFPIWRAYFSDGLKPPTSQPFFEGVNGGDSNVFSRSTVDLFQAYDFSFNKIDENYQKSQLSCEDLLKTTGLSITYSWQIGFWHRGYDLSVSFFRWRSRRSRLNQHFAFKLKIFLRYDMSPKTPSSSRTEREDDSATWTACRCGGLCWLEILGQ